MVGDCNFGTLLRLTVTSSSYCDGTYPNELFGITFLCQLSQIFFLMICWH